MNEKEFTEAGYPSEKAEEAELCGTSSISAEENDGELRENETEEAEKADEENADCSYSEPCDYSSDIDELAEKFPEMRNAESISELKNPLRYAALRDLGLSAEEAYLATSGARPRMRDNRNHLGGSVPRPVSAPHAAMSARELRYARELFDDISDAEIIKLYSKVTKQ